MAAQYRVTPPPSSILAAWERERCEIWRVQPTLLAVVASELRGRVFVRVHNSAAVGRYDFLGLYADDPRSAEANLDAPKFRIRVSDMTEVVAAAPIEPDPERPRPERAEPPVWLEHLSEAPWGSGWYLAYVAWDYASDGWQLATAAGPTPPLDCRHERSDDEGR